MTYHIESRVLTAQNTAVVRGSMPTERVPAWMAGVYEQVNRYLTDRGIRTDGPPFARYTFHGGAVDVEAGFPVLEPIRDGGRVVSSRLPGGTAAVTTHYGRYEDLALAYQAIADWMKERGVESAGPHWEVYYTNPAAQPDPATWSTDVVMPYWAGRG
ncbi:GyrI-like domain-containing protein [Paractinoplanes hotanensis]|uniref:GyrI-like domain-containing protein n=1 Tax=Paractinoplanes hotanensis TaxID=2906497 RepID=A0ABT0YE89_9ACTN|nr:GyrI-like domain-containing protein [Actinoplanes hotanensis]MCM4084370.1 GyrI-like domain-containing protein [Actinoplanes hotanensis]